MELYVYETPNGHIADFRPYLDGRDHSFDDHRALPATDARWEKIHNLRDPQTHEALDEGDVRFVGKAATKWLELMVFPLRWDREFEPEYWSAE